MRYQTGFGLIIALLLLCSVIALTLTQIHGVLLYKIITNKFIIIAQNKKILEQAAMRLIHSDFYHSMAHCTVSYKYNPNSAIMKVKRIGDNCCFVHLHHGRCCFVLEDIGAQRWRFTGGWLTQSLDTSQLIIQIYFSKLTQPHGLVKLISWRFI